MDEIPADINERMELHNQSVLLASAQKKLQEGRRLTVSERKAVEDATNSKQRAVELPFMERMPKKEFIERFGGSPKVHLEWEKRWGFPWNAGERFVNVLDCVRWFREYVAGDFESSSNDPDNHAWRLKKAQADREELRLAKENSELLHVEDVDRDFRSYAMHISDAIESIENISHEAYQIMLAALARMTDEYNLSNITTNSAEEDQRSPQPGAE